jgi:hypothetical protein
LSTRLGINSDRLPPAYTISTLLNPMFGLKPVITGSKLMNEQQYNHAREDVVCSIQTELDRRNPVGFNAGNGSDSENSLDGIQVDDENDNRRLAEREMRRLEQYKMQKYLTLTYQNDTLSWQQRLDRSLD